MTEHLLCSVLNAGGICSSKDLNEFSHCNHQNTLKLIILDSFSSGEMRFGELGRREQDCHHILNHHRLMFHDKFDRRQIVPSQTSFILAGGGGANKTTIK